MPVKYAKHASTAPARESQICGDRYNRVSEAHLFLAASEPLDEKSELELCEPAGLEQQHWLAAIAFDAPWRLATVSAAFTAR